MGWVYEIQLPEALTWSLYLFAMIIKVIIYKVERVYMVIWYSY